MTDEGKFSDSDKRIILFELQKTLKSKITVNNKINRMMIAGRNSSSNHDNNNNHIGDYYNSGDIDDNNNNDNNEMMMMLIQNNILYYFYYDNLSITNQIILNYKRNRDDDYDDININNNYNYHQIIYSIISLVSLFIMISYLFYFILYQIKTSLYQQQIYIYSFCISIIIDYFIVQMIIIMIYDIILPFISMKEVHRCKEILLDCMIIQKNRNDNINNNNSSNNNNSIINHDDNNNNPKSQRSSRLTAAAAVSANQSGFNTANYYYISRQLAKEFDSLIESKLISIYHTTDPMISSRINQKAIDKEYYKHLQHHHHQHHYSSCYYCMVGFYIITTKISNSCSSITLLFLQLPIFIQEFIIQSSTSIIISITIITLMNVYHIYTFYSFIPLIVLTIIMILWLRFTAYHDYMRRFKLYQHLALLLNVQHLFRVQSKEFSNLQIGDNGNVSVHGIVRSGRSIMNQERSKAFSNRRNGDNHRSSIDSNNASNNRIGENGNNIDDSHSNNNYNRNDSNIDDIHIDRTHHTKRVNNHQSNELSSSSALSSLSSKYHGRKSIRQIASSIQNLFTIHVRNPTIVAPISLSSSSSLFSSHFKSGNNSIDNNKNNNNSNSIRNKDHSDQGESNMSIHSTSYNSFGGNNNSNNSFRSSRSALSTATTTSAAVATGASPQKGRRFSLDRSVRAVFGGLMNVAKGSSSSHVNNKEKIKNDNDIEANIYQLSDSDDENDKDIYQLSDSDEETIYQLSDADDDDDLSMNESDILSSDDNGYDNDNNHDNYDYSYNDIYIDNEDSDSISYEGDNNDDYTDVVNGHYDNNNNYSYDDADGNGSNSSNHIHRNRLIVRKVVDDYPNPVHIIKVKRSSFSDSIHLSKIQEEISKDDDSSC